MSRHRHQEPLATTMCIAPCLQPASMASVQQDSARMSGVKKQHRKLTKQHAAVGRSLSKGGR